MNEKAPGWRRPNVTISTEEQNAWLRGDALPGVAFRMLQRVNVIAGPDAGICGALITIYATDPEPMFHLETDKGNDVVVAQSQLRAVAHSQ